MEEKQLFLQRNQELLEKVQFTFDFTFINTEALVLSLSRVHYLVFEVHCPAKGLASTSVLTKCFTHSLFANLLLGLEFVQIADYLYHFI